MLILFSIFSQMVNLASPLLCLSIKQSFKGIGQYNFRKSKQGLTLESVHLIILIDF